MQEMLYPGTGVGLGIVRKDIERMNSKIGSTAKRERLLDRVTASGVMFASTS